MKSAREILDNLHGLMVINAMLQSHASNDGCIDETIDQLEAEINRIIGEDVKSPSVNLQVWADAQNELLDKQRQRLREFLEGDLNI